MKKENISTVPFTKSLAWQTFPPEKKKELLRMYEAAYQESFDHYWRQIDKKGHQAYGNWENDGQRNRWYEDHAEANAARIDNFILEYLAKVELTPEFKGSRSYKRGKEDLQYEGLESQKGDADFFGCVVLSSAFTYVKRLYHDIESEKTFTHVPEHVALQNKLVEQFHQIRGAAKEITLEAHQEKSVC